MLQMNLHLKGLIVMNYYHPHSYPLTYYTYPPMCMCQHQRMYGVYPHNYEVKNNYLEEYEQRQQHVRDQGKKPFVINIEKAAKRNRTFRTAIWTGKHLQVTLMSINVSEDIGLEVHPNTDQFLRIEEGKGLVQMGDRKNNLYFRRRVSEDDAIMVPAGMWHNVTNTGNEPLKLYSIYAPPEHPFGTVHRTKADENH